MDSSSEKRSYDEFVIRSEIIYHLTKYYGRTSSSLAEELSIPQEGVIAQLEILKREGAVKEVPPNGISERYYTLVY